jgi:hypothetical protein
MIPLVAGLLKVGLPLLAEAVLSKGKEVVEEKLGVKLPDLKAGEDLTPEQSVELFRLQSQERVALEAMNLERLEIDAKDRDSARQREMKVRDKIPGLLAIGVTTGFFTILGYVIVYGLPASSGEPILVLLGSLGTGWGMILNYYFGSSYGSAVKNKWASIDKP